MFPFFFSNTLVNEAFALHRLRRKCYISTETHNEHKSPLNYTLDTFKLEASWERFPSNRPNPDHQKWRYTISLHTHKINRSIFLILLKREWGMLWFARSNPVKVWEWYIRGDSLSELNLKKKTLKCNTDFTGSVWQGSFCKEHRVLAG